MTDVVSNLFWFYFLCIMLPIIAVGLFFTIWIFRRARNVLYSWAYDNGYRIIKSEYRYSRKGPFTWTSRKNQVVYRVTVQDARGKIRHGWVRCGSFSLGPLDDVVDVSWESEHPRRH